MDASTPVDELARPKGRVAPRRFALIIVVALANGIGYLPYLLLIERLNWLLLVCPAATILATLALRKQTSEATAHPSFGEWLLGTWSAVAVPSVVSLMGVLLYGVFYGGQQAYVWLSGQFGYAAVGDPSIWGFWGSVWLVAVVSFVGPTSGAERLWRQLYPREAWARSNFAPFVDKSQLGWTVLVGAAALLALVAMLWFLDPRGGALPTLLALIFFYTSLPLAKLGEDAEGRSEPRLVRMIAWTLERAGYRVVLAPRTGKPEIDPLLQSIDLLARDEKQAFAFDVKFVLPGTMVEWTEATAVRSAAELLSEEIVGESGPPVPVAPVLVMVGGTAAQSLEAFCQREGVPFLHFATIQEATDQELTRRLQALGVKFPSALPAAATPQ